MKRLILTFVFLFVALSMFATHNRAGQIVYEHVDGYTYKIYIWTYTYTLSAADRDSLPVKWGDGTQEYVKRVKKITLPDYYYENLYIGYHTYPGPGTYEIVMEDPNRNKDIVNIENSVNTVFALKTVLQINPFVGHNNSPQLLNRPIDKGAVGQVFIHNPGAYDSDGDSLSFKMDTCRYNDGKKIPWFRLPQASDTLYVDPRTGDLVWDTPTQIGKYNMALRVEEWRDGIKISSIIRDMQIEIQEVDNNAPVLQDLPNFCVEAGESVDFDVTATDADGDSLLLTASGGPFEVSISPAVFPDSVKGQSTVTGHFSWQTTCDHIRKEPYLVTFKVKDDNPELSLIDYESIFITVVPPGTKLVEIQPSNATVLIKWNKVRCDNCTGYNIYRKTSPDTYDTTRCQMGVPSSWGYELIAQVPASDTMFVDDNNGHGLLHGFYYCYRVVPVFNDVQGYASNILCTELVEGTPIMINTSVENTDVNNGSIHLKWIKPINLDTVAITPPFRYYLYYSEDLYGAHYYGPVILDGLDTTSYIDTNINTVNNPRIYKLVLSNWDTVTNSWQPVGNPTIASSPYLSGIGYDKTVKLTVEENVPWLIKGHAIYRLNESTSVFDSVGYTTGNTYYDRGLINEKPYTYKVKSIGYYTADTLPHYLENWSQEITVVPIDTIPPCCPDVSVESFAKTDTTSWYGTWSRRTVVHRVWPNSRYITKTVLIPTT